MNYIVGVDIGGTFTDCVVVESNGQITLGKALSTPDDFAQGAVNSVCDAAGKLGCKNEHELLRDTRLFFHGCTVADNTLHTRSGPKLGLVATQGFGDALAMMRGKHTKGLTEEEAAHIASLQKPAPLVPARMIAEVAERVDYKGAVLQPLDLEHAAGAIDYLVQTKGAESLAICLLWSIRNDVHEQALADLIAERYPKLFFTISSEIAPFLGEYERTATTVFNAYVAPTISRYLANLQLVLGQRGLQREPLIMQAYGGVLGVAASSHNAVGLIESGPAAGVAGCAFQGNLIGQPNIVVTDMGGTTFKVGVVRDGRLERDYSPVFMRYNILSTKIWVESIGAGGGSIARIDSEAGLLKVGPQGAGAKPGPVCYDLGGVEPTVSDADLVLGYLNPNYFLGGRMILNVDAATRAIEEHIAVPLRMSLTEAASGIYQITNAHMSDLIHRATVQRGYDPRNFTLFAVGGAAPVHAGRYAAELGIRDVIVPATSAVQGAMGLISSDVVHEYGLSDHMEFPGDLTRINRNFEGLVRKALRDLHAAGFGKTEVAIQRSFDIRYRFQTHELNTPLLPGADPVTSASMEALDGLFDRLYEQSYGAGSGYKKAGKEIVSCRVRAVGTLPRPCLSKERSSNIGHADEALTGQRDVFFQEYGKHIPTPIYRLDSLRSGMRVSGPAVIESPITTIVVNPGDEATMDEFRNVRLRLAAK
jgi:N-methylhydantoinase A